MKVVAIIPARYASTRFPGKPLYSLGGVSVIERVYLQVQKAVEDVIVATDDYRIFSAVETFGGRVVMTSENHKSGTDRCSEAYKNLEEEYDIVLNVQGDEPFITPEQIQSLIECFKSEEVDIATLVKPFCTEDGLESLRNPNTPKVVVDKEWRALYFSRSVVPFLRGIEPENWLKNHTYYKHIGMYGFRSSTLKEITLLPQSPLELAESLEQLRWLEAGYKIGVGVTNIETIGIDTPEDLVKAEEFLKN